jgi:hypothetical protein
MKKSRFFEPSTWAGISGIAGAIAATVPPAAPVAAPLAAIAGALAIWLREGRANDTQ